MNDNCVRDVFDVGSSLSTNLSIVLFALILVVSFKNIGFNIKIKGLMQGLFVFNIQANCIEVLVSFSDIGILRFKRSSFVTKSSSDGIFQKVVALILHGSILFRFFWLWNQLFNLIAESVVKLMCILLDPNIYWLTIELKSINKASWDKIWLLRLLQVCKHSLKLKENIVFEKLLLLLVIWLKLNAKNLFSNDWDHVKLLKQWIHVTCAAEVFEADISGSLFDTDISVKFIHVNVPPWFFYLAVEIVQNFEGALKVFFVLFTEC